MKFRGRSLPLYLSIGISIAACSPQPEPAAPGAAIAEPAAPSTTVEAGDWGSVMQNEARLPIRDYVAWWSVSNRELRVVLSPARISEDEKRRLRDGEMEFMVLGMRDSPDAAKWQWFPFASLTLRFASDEPRAENLSYFYLMAYGVEKANDTVNISRNGPVADDLDLREVALADGKLTLALDGNAVVSGVPYRWSLAIRPE